MCVCVHVHPSVLTRITPHGIDGLKELEGWTDWADGMQGGWAKERLLMEGTDQLGITTMLDLVPPTRQLRLPAVAFSV